MIKLKTNQSKNNANIFIIININLSIYLSIYQLFFNVIISFNCTF